MMIHDVNEGIVGHKAPKRIGRGIGSGHGKTSGRGHKGAKSRSGYKRHFGAEGGQTALFRRIAKRGFSNAAFQQRIAEVNLGDLEAAFDDGSQVNPVILAERGLAKGRFDLVKILGNGELSKKLIVTADRFSASAEQKILAAGGQVIRTTELSE